MTTTQSRLISSLLQHGKSKKKLLSYSRDSSFPVLHSKVLTSLRQPPKRRGAASGSASAQSQPKKARLSKLAKENDITAEEESEIKEAFRLFAITEITSDNEEYASEKEGVMKTPDVRRALM